MAKDRPVYSLQILYGVTVIIGTIKVSGDSPPESILLFIFFVMFIIFTVVNINRERE